MAFASTRALRPLGLAAGLFLVACGGGSGGLPGVPSGDGGGSVPAQNLVVRLRDTPVEAADHVFVTIERVDVYRVVDAASEEGEEDEGGTKVVKETVSSTPGQYDLLELQHGVEAVLGGGTFPPGLYKSIRLIVSKDSKKDLKDLPADQLKNYIVIDGVAHPLVVPSGAQTGIKLGKNFEVAEDGSTVLTIDFDVRCSIRKVGKKKDRYHLRPRLKIVPNVEETGEQGEAPAPFSGFVTTMDNSGLPSGTVVSLQQGGVEVASTMPDPSTGQYTFTGLADGTYDVVVIAPGYTFDSETGVQVVGGGAGTHSYEIAPSDVGLVWGTVTGASSTDVTMRLRWNGFVIATMDADEFGGYLFDNVPVGDYQVEADDGASVVTGPATVEPASATQVDLGF
jgi:hypothetical protein